MIHRAACCLEASPTPVLLNHYMVCLFLFSESHSALYYQQCPPSLYIHALYCCGLEGGGLLGPTAEAWGIGGPLWIEVFVLDSGESRHQREVPLRCHRQHRLPVSEGRKFASFADPCMHL